ncbi:MAG: saccharopine dehydrogenase NADP-binding domain-containing protein [Microthrixaceae bacterium]
MAASERSNRPIDLALFGATGFVGKLTARHLAAHAPEGTSIALAGRSKSRLGEVRDDLGPGAADWPLILADADEPDTLVDLAGQARAIATTVGPYAKWGLPLVEACAEAGTHYADLTGEVLFVRDSIDRAHDVAAQSGARIVHSCGFDSVPSDLAVMVAAEEAGTAEGDPFTEATLVVTAANGGVSGGTVDSMRTQVAAMAADPAKRRLGMDPYALTPDRSTEADLGPQSDLGPPRYDRGLGMWVAPFFMAPYNTRIVRRSNALQAHAYGRRMRYSEVMGFSSPITGPFLAGGVSAGMLAGLAAMSFGPTRKLLDRVLPAPGEGPDESARREGYFRIEVHARTAGGRAVVSSMAAEGDPGYAATAVMLGQSALALALDEDQLPDTAGVLTPATGIGRPLVSRLVARGFDISVRPG